jgi:transitional endoplasmic reticulum ATPase
MFKSPDKIFYILYPRNPSQSASITSPPETDALILAAGKWTSQLHDEIFVFDDGHWSKSRELFRSVAGSSWSDVILSPDMKKGLIEDVQGFFDNQALYKQFAVPWKRGVILHGVPGNGKTVSIKALMNALNERSEPVASLYVKSFETNCNTEQYSIRAIFMMARSMAPCLLIFEDLDSLVNDDIRSYFLNEVDGLESNDGILMIGSTNHLDQLDPAISKRPSRFDRKYHFKLPGMEERRGYAMYWRNKLLTNDTVEFPEDVADVVAQLTEGFSFAYMKELFVMALLSLVRGAKTTDEFEIVEKDEAASPPAPEATPAAEVCTCATECKDCHLQLPTTAAAEAKKKQDEAKEAGKEAEKNKMVMPSVEVPDHLQDNLLLKVIKHQIRILHAEMDNSKDDGEKKKEGGNRAAMRRMMKAGGMC